MNYQDTTKLVSDKLLSVCSPGHQEVDFTFTPYALAGYLRSHSKKFMEEGDINTKLFEALSSFQKFIISSLLISMTVEFKKDPLKFQDLKGTLNRTYHFGHLKVIAGAAYKGGSVGDPKSYRFIIYNVTREFEQEYVDKQHVAKMVKQFTPR